VVLFLYEVFWRVLYEIGWIWDFVKDIPTMIQFYRDVLGFDIKEQEEQVMFI